MQSLLLIYLAGVVAGAWRTDGTLAVRAVHALLWPLGPLAFGITVGVLLAASLIAFPVFGLLAALAAGGVWWLAG